MIIDTDVLIWFYRGNGSAKQSLYDNMPFSISVITQMEIIQGVRNKDELLKFQKDMERWAAEIFQINEPISQKASNLLENYSLSCGLKLADALIAATTIEYNENLLTGNAKHYSFIPNLQITLFIPQ
ncbi:MAG: type II toxin-antitoxin system VapC family toxin [Elusimicrobiota bacterium]|nr:type II toxin-antitoxin system VapC family toxin [Elusimicrobiota bacterium]